MERLKPLTILAPPHLIPVLIGLTDPEEQRAQGHLLDLSEARPCHMPVVDDGACIAEVKFSTLSPITTCIISITTNASSSSKSS